MMFELRQVGRRLASPVPRRLYTHSRRFEEISGDLACSQWWSPERLRQYQSEHLERLVAHAYANVPFYRRVFDARGLGPADVTTVEDLEKLPTLSKEQVRVEWRDLRARNVPDDQVVWKSTSGTTGTPLRVAVSRDLLYYDNDPYHWRHFGWGGHARTDRRATLLAAVLPPTISGERRLYAYNPLRRNLTLSSYDLRPDTVLRYAAALRRHQPAVLLAFPSAAERLVVLLRQAGIACPVSLKAVFMQSEAVYPWQRAVVERYFGCPVFDWYAMEERLICAGDCEQHDGHHIVSEFGIVELLRGPGEPLAGPAEIVATTLHNYAMPLIRYRTGDLAEPIEPPCQCGRGLPRMRLVGGRSRCFAVLGDGHLVSVTIVDIPRASSRVERFQFVQEEPGALLLRVVPGEGFGPEDEEAIRSNLAEKFGPGLRVEIHLVDEVVQTARGKVPILVQRLDLARFGGGDAS